MEDCLKLISELDVRQGRMDTLKTESRQLVARLRQLMQKLSFIEMDALVRQCHSSIVHSEVMTEQRRRLHWESTN